MAGLATFRVLIAMLWLLLGVWFQSTVLLGESSTNDPQGTATEQRKEIATAEPDAAKEISIEDLEAFYEYSEPSETDLDKEIALEHPLPTEWISDYADEFEGEEQQKPDALPEKIATQASRAESEKQNRMSVSTTSVPTESYNWDEENLLSLGLNPKIEVSIEILHDEAMVRPTPTSSAMTLMESIEEGPTSTTATMAKATDALPSTPTTARDLGILPFAIRSLDKDLRPTENDAGEDVCERWMRCPGEQLLSELARLQDLPSCPCMYSFDIHYKDEIWDSAKRHNYRWRDASGPNDHVDIFHAGAKWCIRSLISDGSSSSMAAQQCCYDHKRHLITRGAGAGTPYAISPEVSRELHHKVDVTPWIMCKGDWTRYHLRRSPNNGLHCRENPSDNVYFKQIQKAKNYR